MSSYQSIEVWHLETDIASQPVAPETQRIDVFPLDGQPDFYRYLYIAVGAPWKWYMRLGWDYRQWERLLSDNKVHVFVGYRNGHPAGFFELREISNRVVKIAYFGLVPELIGEGLGGDFLGHALYQAYRLGARRVTLHTCSMDHPNALPNYLERGFLVRRHDRFSDHVPEDIQPWPDASKPAYEIPQWQNGKSRDKQPHNKKYVGRHQ